MLTLSSGCLNDPVAIDVSAPVWPNEATVLEMIELEGTKQCALTRAYVLGDLTEYLEGIEDMRD